MNSQTQVVVDDLDLLLNVLPLDIRQALNDIGRRSELLEVILDLGRVPTARFTDKEIVLLEREVTQDDIDGVVERVGDFDADNRAGIERTLHRIAAIRNRKGRVVGLTCRVGRAVFGTIDIIQDLIESGKSVLIVGRPAVGKTTKLREAARVLAEKKRVVIVDTSNEIAGDGDIPHPAIGRARRMQVSTPSLQHEVMIEAVENHNPEVIVIDEIGREMEAIAARTIAERGVQLIATAHGNTLDNLVMNPTLSDLVGGIESVTLSDEEARRRGTQKTVLERRAPPTFNILVEIQDRERLMVHKDVSMAVDNWVRGRPLQGELRYRDDDGNLQTDGATSAPSPAAQEPQRATTGGGPRRAEQTPREYPEKALFPYGVARNRLRQAADNLGVPITLVDEVNHANVVVTTKRFYRQRPRPVKDAERRGVPIYVLRANTVAQMQSFLADLYRFASNEKRPFAQAMREVEEAISRVQEGEAQWVDLAPQQDFIRRRQHQMIRNANLHSRSLGQDPERNVRIYRDEIA